MASAPERAVIRGWCPGVHAPMASGDGLLVRVKPPGGQLDAAQARALADAAARFGNGVIELTGRANLQIRGLTDAGAPVFAAAMVALGLASAEPGVERRRTVMVSLADNGAAATDGRTLALALEAMLADAALDALATKFGFAVDCGGALALAGMADIGVRTDGARHWILLGDEAAECAPDATLAVVRRLAIRAGGRRMREVLHDEGSARVLAAVGLTCVPCVSPSPPVCVGLIDPAGGAFGMGLPFGQTDAARLRALAGLAETFGDGTLRLTPWRAILTGGVRAADAAAFSHAAFDAGLIVDPADRRLRIAACIGAAGCASGTVFARADAAALALAGGWSGMLHVSGCAKGCAHPGAAAITLVGDAGRYGIVRDGRARDFSGAALTLDQAARAMCG